MSELRTHSLRHNSATGDANIEMYADGSTSIRNLQNFASNLIKNGAMQVAQRGTTSTANGRQTVDGFQVQFASGAVTQSRQDVDETDDAVVWNEGFRRFYRMENTTAIANNTNSLRLFRYFIEAQDMATSGWRYSSDTGARHNVSLSFWIRSSVAQEFAAYVIAVDGTAQLYSFTFTLAANTWTQVTHVIPGGANVEFDLDSERGLQLDICAWQGTDFTNGNHADETWDNFDTASRLGNMTDTWADTADATFDLTGVQLTVTDAPIRFQHKTFTDDRRDCCRYLQPVLGSGTVVLAASTGETTAFFSIPTTEIMRTATATMVGWTHVVVVDRQGGTETILPINGIDFCTRGSARFRVNRVSSSANTYRRTLTWCNADNSVNSASGWVSTEL